jgi:hypothetical protein
LSSLRIDFARLAGVWFELNGQWRGPGHYRFAEKRSSAWLQMIAACAGAKLGSKIKDRSSRPVPPTLAIRQTFVGPYLRDIIRGSRR